MKIYKLPQLADMDPGGEYCLNGEDLKSDAIYLYYGRLRPGEKSKRLAAREGHEEIVYIIKGTLRAKYGKTVFQVSAGEAFHSAKDVSIDNPNKDEAIYLAAGGRGATAAKGINVESSQTKPATTCEDSAEVTAITENISSEEEPQGEEFIITKD